MNNVLFKPNPIVDGIFKKDNSTDLKIFNTILCNLQNQKANGSFIANIKLEQFQEIIKNKNINTAKGILNYIDTNFRKETISWKHDDKIYLTGLITKVTYNNISQTFEIHIDEDVVKFALEYERLKVGFTPINLNLTNKNNSFYAQRLYEIIRKWSGQKKEIIIEIKELKEKLLLTDRYPVFYEFKRRIIDPSVKKINSDFNMNLKYIVNNNGKRAYSLTFLVEDYEPRGYEFNKIVENSKVVKITCDESNPLILKSIEDLQEVKIKIAHKTLQNNLDVYGEELFKRAINILINHAKENKIKAPVKYLTGILENLVNKTIVKDETNDVKSNTKQLAFTNYIQREYDYDSLEKGLRGLEDCDYDSTLKK